MFLTGEAMAGKAALIKSKPRPAEARRRVYEIMAVPSDRRFEA
jgi:hypothetical protein